MTSQYDSIATDYSRTKLSPLREYVEVFSMMQMLGDVNGLNVLDLACGDGFYTRAIRAAGAAQVVGVDISSAMIALARATQSDAPADIEYHVADVAELEPLGAFDLVSAAYLLHYAEDEQQLGKMCSNIAAQLRSGGRLVAINENPAQPLAAFAGYTRYGFNKQAAAPLVAGSAINYSMVSGTRLIKFDAYYYPADVYAAALSDAGFINLRWQPLELAPFVPDHIDDDYFDEYLDNPPVVGLVCELA